MIHVEPLTPERFDDFAALNRLMGPNRGCWCVYWREETGPLRGSRQQIARDVVAASPHPVGVLAYDGDDVVGWAAASPRAQYPRLNRGRDTASIGDVDGVWALPCFFVREDHRGMGVARALIDAAVALAAAHGARAVDAVPGDPATRARSASASYTGTVSMFAAAGFSEVARRTPKGRVLMRREVPS